MSPSAATSKFSEIKATPPPRSPKQGVRGGGYIPEKKETTMRYALIGCGMISPNHIRAAVETGLEIVALCDLVEENRAKALALIPEEKRGGVKLYADHREMLEKECPDLTAVALGSGIKRQIVCDCLDAGSHVIVEKPIALSLEDADAMMEAAERNRRKLCVNHQLRFCPSVRALHALSRDGSFGKLLHGAAQVRRNRNKAYFDAGKWRGTWKNDGGTLMNQCIHYTDLLQWIFGDAEEVFAYTDRLTHPYIEAEDMGLALVKFTSGAYAVIEGTVNVYPNNLSDSLAVFGSDGTVSVSGKYLDNAERWQFADGTASLADSLAKYSVEDMGAGHTPLYRDMIEAIEQDREPVCSAREGRRALELVLGIYESAASGRPVRFPLQRGATTDYIGRFDK